MDRKYALEQLELRLTNKNLVKHSIAVESIMRKISEHFSDDVEKWGLAGLLHDIDYELTANEPEKHGVRAEDILENMGADEAIIYSIKAHNDLTGIERKRKMDKALYSADPVSGLITAAALILPSKKLLDVTVEFLLKRMDEKTFAKGANREQIKTCSDFGFSIEEFLKISLQAMQGVSEELGL